MVNGNMKILLAKVYWTIYIVEELTLADLVPQPCPSHMKISDSEDLIRRPCTHNILFKTSVCMRAFSVPQRANKKPLSFCSLRIIAFSIKEVLLQAYKAQEV